GRNNTGWDAVNDYVAFVPTCLDIQTVTVHALPSDALAVSPATTTICAGSVVPVTITSASSGVLYQLRNSADDSPFSGFYAGNGGSLVINSDPVSANVTLKVFARNAATLCETDLTSTVAITVDTAPSAS